jgi:hypothetical protein
VRFKFAILFQGNNKSLPKQLKLHIKLDEKCSVNVLKNEFKGILMHGMMEAHLQELNFLNDSAITVVPTFRVSESESYLGPVYMNVRMCGV